MKPMIEIYFSDGTIRRVPESNFIAGGELMIPVLDVGFNSLEDGLVLYFLHYEPERPDETMIDRQTDPRGLSAAFYNDSYAVIVPPERMHLVDRVYYEGELQLIRFSKNEPLIFMNKINNAAETFLKNSDQENARFKIAEVYAEMFAQYKSNIENDIKSGVGTIRRMPSDDDIKESVCQDLGIPRAFAEGCVEYKSSYDTRHADDDEDGGKNNDPLASAAAFIKKTFESSDAPSNYTPNGEEGSEPVAHTTTAPVDQSPAMDNHPTAVISDNDSDTQGDDVDGSYGYSEQPGFKAFDFSSM